MEIRQELVFLSLWLLTLNKWCLTIVLLKFELTGSSNYSQSNTRYLREKHGVSLVTQALITEVKYHEAVGM